MKKPIPKIRVFGQRSIASSFLNRSSIPVDVEASSGSKNLSKPVLVKPKNTEEGRRPFTSLVSSKDLTQLSHGLGMERKVREEKKDGDGGLEKMMLQQFKPREIQIREEVSRDITGEASLEQVDHIAAEEIDNLASHSNEDNEDIIIVKDDQTSKKRKDPFEGMESISRTGKSVIVFGDNSNVSNPMQRESQRGRNNNSKKQRPAYNHYANGSGWWDCDMEGVDSEEVGHSEVWEGVGSTTFGDIVDWH
ncbi:hypothetical protein CARUB_v10005594mg [Capsella rubella]|uniref:Uncharacterized protein n=1 Tax=Capsella rubella TaxID=81985 RepID=R0F670_9BRAS|nr:uncharacterized protein LOC17877507 isoform X2 [Capsella rubella]EOA17322.1 hypothetical protein CARUB_v10005594mg [Capsella rubella]